MLNAGDKCWGVKYSMPGNISSQTDLNLGKTSGTRVYLLKMVGF